MKRGINFPMRSIKFLLLFCALTYIYPHSIGAVTNDNPSSPELSGLDSPLADEWSGTGGNDGSEYGENNENNNNNVLEPGKGQPEAEQAKQVDEKSKSYNPYFPAGEGQDEFKHKSYAKTYEIPADITENLEELDLSVGRSTFSQKFLAVHLKRFGDRITGMNGVYVEGYNTLSKVMYAKHSALFDRKFSGTRITDHLIGNIADFGPFFLQTAPVNTKVSTGDYLKAILLSKVQYLLGADFRTQDNLKRLENIGTVLGFNNTKANKNLNDIPTVSLSTELFWSFGTNPFLFGHLATLALGYLESDAYFSATPSRPFYSWHTLLSLGGDEKFDKLDAMCGVIRGSKYSRGSNGLVKPHYKRSRRKDLLSGEPRVLCSMLEEVLQSVDTAIKMKGEELNLAGANYEITVPSTINSKRIQAKLCSDPNSENINVNCDFETSALDHSNHELKEAFNLLLACEKDKGKGVSQDYLNLISSPFEYDDVFALTLSWDHRPFHGDYGWVHDYKKYRHAVFKNSIKDVDFNLKFDSAIAYYSQIKQADKLFQDKTPWGRLYLYLSVVVSKFSIMQWAEDSLHALTELYHAKPSLVIRGQGIKSLLAYCFYDPVALSHLYLYHFLTKKDAGRDLDRDLRKFSRGNLVTRLTTSSSIFIPNKLKKLLKMGSRGFLTKKLNTLKAKRTLLRLFPKKLLYAAINAIEFTTHSLATLQISKNFDMWANLAQFREKEGGGFPGKVDSLFRTWSDDGGYTKHISEKLESGEELNKEEFKELNMKAPISNDTLNWQKFINGKVSEYFEKILDIPVNQTVGFQKNYILQLVKDSKNNLDNNLDNTIFLGKVLPPRRTKNVRKKARRAVKSLSSLLLRKSARPVDHAVWVGVKLNVPLILQVVEKLYMLQKDMPKHEAWNLEGAFLELLEDMVVMATDPGKRSPIGFSALDGNPGLPEISIRYAFMADDERKVEFQQSQCADHCVSIWRSIIAFTLNTLNNPAAIKQYEKSLSSNASLNDITKPEYVNSFKYLLKGDSVLHMYDNMLPTKVKHEIKALKYGKGLYFASIMQVASLLFGGMGYPYVSRMLSVQAPYLGNFVVNWQKRRESAKSSEVLSYLTFGTMASYAVISSLELVKHANAVIGPPETCWFHPRPAPGQKHCIALPIKSIAEGATKTAINDVFSVGLMACIGPYFIFPMAGVAAWSVLRSQFKVLDRVHLAFTGLFSKFFSTLSSKAGLARIKGWFRQRHKIKKDIVEHAKAIREKGGKPEFLNTLESPLFNESQQEL